MPVTRYTYDVALITDGETIEHRVTVNGGDRLRAELEAGRHGIKPEQAQNTTAVILWCALTRLGHVSCGYQEFRNELLDEFDIVKGADGRPLTTAPDPTQADTSASDSSSPATSVEALSSGSIPT